MNSNLNKVWLVSANMGYGHLRAIYPLKDLAEGGIITVGKNGESSEAEQKLWSRILDAYEMFSRARGIPVVGKFIFKFLDTFLHIPSYYPRRNLSDSTFQVGLLESSVKKGLCSKMLEKIKTKNILLVTSFYAPAVAADINGYNQIYCIICDSDLNRVWVARDPWESRIEYFAPCGKAAQRLRDYGVPEERIYLTGFPLPKDLLGNRELNILKSDLGQRLNYLDPNSRFKNLHERNIEYFIGAENLVPRNDRVLTISYAVGGAGAQKEIGSKIALSLKQRLLDKEINLNLIAGTKEIVRDYFNQIKDEYFKDCENLKVFYSKTFEDYYSEFNNLMKTTDILWSKPSELSFYCALGIPIIMTPTIGSQEKFNRQWLREIGAGISQESPDYADQWLFDWLNKGRLAEAAWDGFLKARKLGIYNIEDILQTGKMTKLNSPVLR
ncbi:MAG TPA: hypothetical protein VKA26_15330 [Ignavibacteriaceae bacterium]|nr:hypothetical protein [Ignavibacteriaceae bacterium]